MSELKKCPICHEQAKIGYACGDYFAHCSDGCPSPMCDHASESTTVCAWNDWAEWCEKYRRAQPENEALTFDELMQMDGEPVLKVAELVGKEYVSIDLLKDFEQVDAVPVVRGYSYEDDKTYSGPGTSNYICSACGEMQGTWKKGLAQNQKFKFCPWCGAKMEDKP